MLRWTGVALALRRPEDDQLKSRLSTYLHPLAGRSLVWHSLSSVVSRTPRPLQMLLVSGDPSLASGLDELRVQTIFPARGVPWAARVGDRLHPSAEAVLILDAAAASLDTSLDWLVNGPTGRALRAADGDAVAAWMDRKRFIELSREAPDLDSLVADVEMSSGREAPPPGDDAFVVRDREALARAAGHVRRRIVRDHMASGVTFLDPAAVLVDVDVRIGPDSVIYPGAVLEGRTTIGSETVVGPGCRIIDSQVGSGVELKGCNYLVNTNIRNRAVLEPYVRRGYD